MTRIIRIESCKQCPYCVHTDDYDSYCGYKCEKSRNVGWSYDEFNKIDDIDENCPLEQEKLIDKTIEWFDDIAEMSRKLTTGNVAHLGATIRGKAIRAKEFMEKHKNDEKV